MIRKKIFISSGGTGGHIMPARCLAEYLAEKQCLVFFFGDEKYRNYVRHDDKFESQIISSSQFNKSPFNLIKSAAKIFLGVIQSCYFFLKIRPNILVAFGGYATFPLLIVAVLFRTKIILHEQNAHLGKVNRIFAKFAAKIATSFEQVSGVVEACKSKVVFTGNPIRKEILKLHAMPYLLQDKFQILVVGGSGGAKIFSEILPKAISSLSENIKSRLVVVQQCRQELLQETFSQYKKFNINISINHFFDNMPDLIRDSHLVIARSGSSSIFEFCAARRPMILIPFAKAADNHQEKNARYLERRGAAMVISENDFTINEVSELLKNLISDHDSLCRMSEKSASSAVLDATENLEKLLRL